MNNEIERLRAVLEAATPGPWHALYGSRDVLDMIHAEGAAGTIILADVHDLGGEPGTPNTIAIAAALTLLPALLDVAEAADGGNRHGCSGHLRRELDCVSCTSPDLAASLAALDDAIREHFGDAS